jgi:anaerobic selenocysteine-containing dehydrogenase
MRIHPDDAKELGIVDGNLAIIETEAGSATVEAEVTESSFRGQVVIPMASVLCIWERHTESMLTSWLQQSTGTVWQPRHCIVIYPAG